MSEKQSEPEGKPMPRKQQWKWSGRTDLLRARVEPDLKTDLMFAAEHAGVSESEALRQGARWFIEQNNRKATHGL